MYNLDERLAWQRYQERLQAAEQERLVRAVRRARRQTVKDESPTFRPWHPGHWFARRPAVQAPPL